MNALSSRARQLVEAAEAEVDALVQLAEKEFTMIPQNVADAIARIKAALSVHSDQSTADAQTISNLQGQVATLQGQLNDLTSGGEAKDSQIASLTQQVNDLTAQLNEVEAAVTGIETPVA